MIAAERDRATTDRGDVDRLDLLLLDALQRNARSTYAELGTVVGLKPPAVHERVKRLEARGFVRGYAAQIDARRLGYELGAFVAIYTLPEVTYEEVTQAISDFPEITEIHSVAGEETLLTKVLTRSTDHLDDLLSRMKKVRGVSRTRTTIVLSTPFNRGGIPIETAR